MAEKSKLKLSLIWLAFASVCFIAATLGKQTETVRWYSVVPPLLAVTLALVTHKVIFSLGIAVVVGGLLATVPGTPLSPMAWVSGIGKSVGFVTGSALDEINLQILLFVVFVIAMIAVMVTSGGVQAVINWLMRFAKGWKSTQLVTALMGIALFFDDYANTMIVGNSLRPLTDKQKISREKLAFLVDATSAPIAGIAIISTWIGYEIGLFGDVSKSLGIGLDGYSMFFDALGFRFYCILMIVFILVNAVSGQDYGPMAAAQKRSLTTGKVLADDATPITSRMDASNPHKGVLIKASAAIVPMLVLFAFLFGGIWRDGGGMEKLSVSAAALFSFSAWREVVSSGENTTFVLTLAALMGLLAASIMAAAVSKAPLSAIGRAILSGARSSLLPMVILILAWSLKAGCDALLTGKFLAGTLSDVVSPMWFPVLLFLVSGLTAFATGTSWGTMAILIPTAIPVAFALDGSSYGLITMISLGAILDGAIFGDHCSPISDTTIMSSTASSCDHIHHVRTQIPYSLTVAGFAIFLGYLPAALGIPSWVSLLTATAFILGLYWALSLRKKTEEDDSFSNAQIAPSKA